METDRRNHWEQVYDTKQPNEVSWTQQHPTSSLRFIQEANLNKSSKIIDIGGGDSRLIDYLLEEGYINLTVLDISAKALEKAKSRLGEKANHVTWIVCDIVDFVPETSYDLWHDRATFHFLTTKENIDIYCTTVQKFVVNYLVIGTFSEEGPTKCSGLEIKQYSDSALQKQFSNAFEKIDCFSENHETPFKTLQNFTFCLFKKN